MKTLSLLVSFSLAEAASLIGTKEVPLGSNRGPLVTKFLNSIGLSGGYPWCAAFVWYCIQVAAGKLKTENPFVRSGACVIFERWAKEQGILKDTPEKGDVFLSYSIPDGESRRRASHTGFVVDVFPKSQKFATIEGNTNLVGSREGIGVFKRTREFDKTRYKFIRWNDVVKALKIEVQPKAPSPEVRVAEPYKVFLSGKLIYSAMSRDGRTWLPLDVWCGALGIKWSFNTEYQVVKIQGREAGLDTRSDVHESGKIIVSAPVRQLVKFSGLLMEVDDTKREIHISRFERSK